MKNLTILILLGIGIIFSGCTEDLVVPDDSLATLELKSAKKPAPNLVVTGACDFTFTPPYFWNGTADFGDLGEYKATFESLGEPRNFSMASPFKEILFVYDIEADWPASEEDIYLRINFSGVVTLANSGFLSNGKVIGASGPLADWLGCTAHTKGIVSWAAPGLPSGAEWTLRLN